MAKRQIANPTTVRTVTREARPVQTATQSISPAGARATHQQIAERAYYIWLRKGRPHGQDQQIWRQAEIELLGRSRSLK